MKYGLTHLSIIPLRREAAHRSELVSQLLFGESYKVLEKKENWLRIACIYDGYEGWIDENQHRELSEKDFNNLLRGESGVALDMVCNASSSHQSIPILSGSSLPLFDGMNFKMGKGKFIYNGQAIQPDAQNSALFERIAMRYLNAPYLWGGRSPFGIDCSGFTQVIFKFMGIKLPRDAWQQAEQGSVVNFIEESRPGDFAFFHNEDGKIIHTGMILKDRTIIHASGKVRVDKIDHFGIHNSESKKYSHQLKLIKRFF
ncbi:MAG: C40 family peptidase [Bacteroidetes bacterium]|nr:C40 family peptidase [Bacteroidota bacterium]